MVQRVGKVGVACRGTWQGVGPAWARIWPSRATFVVAAILGGGLGVPCDGGWRGAGCHGCARCFVFAYICVLCSHQQRGDGLLQGM